MVRKLLTLSLAVMAFSLTFAQEAPEQNAEVQATDTVKGIHPFKEATKVAPKWAHWSLIVEGGINFLDDDFHSEAKSVHLGYPTVGIGVEYNFRPSWSVGVDYRFAIPRVEGNPDGSNADLLYKGYMHRPEVYIAFDLINAFFPEATKKIFSFNLIAGGGAAIYKRTTYYPDQYGADGKIKNGNTAKMEPSKDDKYKATGYLMGGAMAEFNLNRSLALGAKATYSFFTRDDIEGRYGSSLASKNNDGMFDLSLFLRWKIDATKRSHVRDVSNIEDTEDYYHMPNKRRNSPANNYAGEPGDSRDMGQGAPQQRGTGMMADAAPKRDTLVVLHRDTVVMAEKEIAEVMPASNSYYIYYNPDKSQIDNGGLMIIQQVADRMNRDTALYAIVIGYCDNTASEDYNMKLAQRRAETAADELVSEHGIASDRVAVDAKGIIRGKRSLGAYAPNRRIEIRLVNKEEFEAFQNAKQQPTQPEAKAQKQEAKAEVAPAAKEQPVVKAEKVEVLEGEENTLAYAVTEKGDNLTKLARRYYNNPYSWIYIYMANTDKLPNPDYVQDGVKLRLPVLTESQWHVTKEESKAQLEAFLAQNK